METHRGFDESFLFFSSLQVFSIFNDEKKLFNENERKIQGKIK